jgi:hypothetical protein
MECFMECFGMFWNVFQPAVTPACPGPGKRTGGLAGMHWRLSGRWVAVAGDSG